MPAAIPLIAAGAEIAAGASAIAAGSAVVGGLMVAGGVLTGLGALTGNKKLSQLGAIAGLAGGIGGLATGAWATPAQEVANSSSLATDSLAQTATPVAQDAAAAAGAEAQPFMSPDALAEATTQAGGATANAGGGIIESAATKSPLQDLVPGASGYDPSAGVNPAGITKGVGASAAGNTPIERLGHTLSDGWDSVKEGASKFGGWVEKNPTLAKMGSGLVGGAMTNYEKQREMQAQEDYYNRRRQQYSDSLNGVRAPVYQKP